MKGAKKTKSDKWPTKGDAQKSAKDLKVRKKDFDKLLSAMSACANEKADNKKQCKIVYNYLKNNSLLLIGYSFGDVYINHVIERMELIHGDKKRIVLIDWWPINEEIEKITDENIKQGLIKENMKFYTYEDNINHELFKFLCRMTGKTQFEEVMKSFKSYDRSGPMVSTNGCLMLFIGGFKAASEHKEIIYDFLNS